MIVTLDFDDFSLENNNLYYLLKLKEHHPDLKVSLFMIPFDVAYYNRLQDFQRKDSIEAIKQNLDWLELIPHGLTHKPAEFQAATRPAMESVVKAIDRVFGDYGLPYTKGFKAPYWLYTQDVVDYLDEIGWWIAVDRNQPKAPRTKKYFEYTHSIDEPFWEKPTDPMKLHGHISLPSANNLPDNMINLLKIPQGAEFQFASQVLCEK